MNLRRVLHVVGLLTLVVVVVPFVVYAFPGAVGADHSFVVLSGSMEPDISAGDVVIVDDRPTEAIAEGDVITFVRNEGEKPVTHRVVDIEERDDITVFTTKGDANEDVDTEPVPAPNVLGEVTITIPYIGYAIQFAQRPVGFVLLVLLPLGLLGLSEIWGLINDDSGDESVQASDETVAAAVSPDSDEPTTGGEPLTGDETTDDEITLTATDLTLTGGLLALVAPYTVYVALQLRDPVTFTAAFAAAFSLVGVAGLWLTTRGDDTGQPAGAAESPDDDDGGDGDDWDEDAFDGGDADWTPVDTDRSFAFDDSDGDGFADEFDGAFGDSAEATANPADTATEAKEPAADVTADTGTDDGVQEEAGFFDGPAPDAEPTDSTVFDDSGSTEEVN